MAMNAAAMLISGSLRAMWVILFVAFVEVSRWLSISGTPSASTFGPRSSGFTQAFRRDGATTRVAAPEAGHNPQYLRVGSENAEISRKSGRREPGPLLQRAAQNLVSAVWPKRAQTRSRK